MAITSSILSSRRLTHTVSIVAGAAADTVTIPLTSTLISDQTSSSSISLAVNISGAWSSTGSGVATISRNGITVLSLTNQASYPQAGVKMPAISQNNTTAISVTFSTPGQVILELHKVAGTVDPNYNLGDYK